MDRAIFLDRDGVINRMTLGQYVRNWDEFEFLDGVPGALSQLAKTEYKLIIITNQSPIGRGMMTEEELASIHKNMVVEIEEAGGRIDAIYFCPHTPEDNCNCRKPNTGLFDKVNEFFDIDYTSSWFIGDFKSDEEVADRMGLRFMLAKGDGELARVTKEILSNDS